MLFVVSLENKNNKWDYVYEKLFFEKLIKEDVNFFFESWKGN